MALLIERKKEEKRRRLLDSAYSCFLSAGISSTSIAEICTKAGIAKGTFYLYFKDKEDIAKALNLRLSYGLLRESYDYMNAHRKKDFVENVILMADYILERFTQDTDLLKLLRRDFTWPVARQELIESKDTLIMDIRTQMSAYAEKKNRTMNYVLMQIFALTGMIATVAYSAIIDSYPCPISLIKPVLFDTIRRTLSEE
jgi:AcrR family transcriptional regulator